MKDRRRFPRQPAELEFFCYVDGERFDSAAIDISPAGVFLASEDILPEGTVVMLVPKDEASEDFPVHLVGRIVRREEQPGRRGYGMQWLRCLSRAGIKSIFRFIASYPEFSELTLPLPDTRASKSSVVGYDFKLNRFYVPDVAAGRKATVKATTRPAPKASAQPEPGLARTEPTPFVRSREEGAVTRALKQLHEQVPMARAVSLTVGDKDFAGTLRMLSLGTLFVELNTLPSFDGNAVVVRLAVPIGQHEVLVKLQCTIHSHGCHAALPGIAGLHLTVDGVEEGKYPGLFERYAKLLYYQMVSQR